jgi:hypothetical protein
MAPQKANSSSPAYRRRLSPLPLAPKATLNAWAKKKEGPSTAFDKKPPPSPDPPTAVHLKPAGSTQITESAERTMKVKKNNQGS